MAEQIVGYAASAFMSMLSSFFHSIGWGTIAVIAVACIAAASLSMNAMKLLSRPRGLAVSAGVLLAGAAYAWWMWPVSTASAEVGSVSKPGGSSAGTVTKPDDYFAKKEEVKPVPAPAKEKRLLAARTVAPGPEAMPWMPPTPMVTLPVLPVGIGTVGVASTHVNASSHGTHHPAAKPPSTSHTTVSRATTAPAPVKAVGGSKPLASRYLVPAPPSPKPTAKPGPAVTSPSNSGHRPASSRSTPFQGLVSHGRGFGPSGDFDTPHLSVVGQRKINNRRKSIEGQRALDYWFNHGAGGFIPSGGLPHMGGRGHTGHMGHTGGMTHHGGHH